MFQHRLPFRVYYEGPPTSRAFGSNYCQLPPKFIERGPQREVGGRRCNFDQAAPQGRGPGGVSAVLSRVVAGLTFRPAHYDDQVEVVSHLWPRMDPARVNFWRQTVMRAGRAGRFTQMSTVVF